MAEQVVLPKINTPAENARIVAEGQQAQQVTRENALKLEAQQRTAQQQQAVLRVMQESNGDWEVALPRLRQIAPDAATKYEKHLSDERAARLASMKSELEIERTQTERALALLRALPKGDQAMYAELRGPLARIAPDLEGFLPEQYDAEALERIQTIGLSAKDAIARTDKAYELLAEGKHHQAAAFALSAAQDAEDWQEALVGLREQGVPRAVLQTFGAWTGPASAKRAEQIAMTPDARADNARADAQLEEQKRQAKEDEAIARGQLSVSQGNLAVARGNLAERRREGSTQPLVAVQGPDGQPMLVTREQAVGKRPAPGAAGAAAGGKGGPDVGAIFREIRTLSSRINTSDSGPMATGIGLARRGLAGVNLDNDVAEYEALIEGMIPMVARAVGHTGVLTQADVDSVRAMFPRPTDSQTLARNKLQRIEGLIGAGSGAMAPPAGTSAPTAPAPLRQPIPGVPGGIAELQPDGRWKRVQ